MDTLLMFISWFLIGIWLILEMKMWWLSRTWKTLEDFDLTVQEQSDLTRARRKAANASQNVIKSQRQIMTLEQKGKNLRRNRNGEFDRRSKLGKTLNKDIKRIQGMAFLYDNKFIQAENEIETLLKIPWLRIHPWINSEAYRITSRLIIIGFALSFHTMSMIDLGSSYYWFAILGLWCILFFVILAIYRKILSTKFGY